MDSSTVSTNTRRSQAPWRPELVTVLSMLLLLIIGFMVIYPLLMLIIKSFQVGTFGQATTTGVENWTNAFTQPRLLRALANTFALAATRQAIAFAIGLGIAWLLARTNIPGRSWLEFGFWIALLLPALPTLMGWILLLDGHYGVMNTLLEKLPFIHSAVFNIFSWWGIIFAHLAIGVVAIKVFLLTPALRNLDTSYEEASLTLGGNPIRTFLHVTVPLMLPTIMIVELFGFIRSMQSFEIELILGGPPHIQIFSTVIYSDIMQVRPLYGEATALSTGIMVMLIPFILLQQWAARRRSRVAISGKYSRRRFDLGRWRWFFFGLIVFILFVTIVLPTSFMVVGTFMKVYGLFNLPHPWTFENWTATLTDSQLISAALHTIFLALGSTAIAIVLFTLAAYVVVRTKFIGRHVMDFITWLPSTVPGIVSSLGVLLLFVSTPIFRPLYGTIWVLVIALSFANVTLGFQLIKTSLMQVGPEVEEASRASGASWLLTMRRIIVPLIAPTIAVVTLQTFALAASAVNLVALLGTPGNEPLSLLQLTYISTGLFERASVVGVIIFVFSLAAAVSARFVSQRLGLERFD